MKISHLAAAADTSVPNTRNYAAAHLITSSKRLPYGRHYHNEYSHHWI